MSQDNDEIEVDISYAERETKSEPDGQKEREIKPSGSRTMDKRLNPNAPEFVPGLTASLLANKILEEIPTYRSWSHAASPENLSYGVRYDYIWRESSMQMRPVRCPFNTHIVARSMSLNIEAKPYVPKSREMPQQLTDMHDVVGDVEQSHHQQQQPQQHQQQQQQQLQPDPLELCDEMSKAGLHISESDLADSSKDDLHILESDLVDISKADLHISETDLVEHYRCCGCRIM